MNQSKFNRLLTSFQSNNPDYVGFCDGWDEAQYNGYWSGGDEGDPGAEWIEGEKELFEKFSEWYKIEKNIIVCPIALYALWLFHSVDWHAQFLCIEEKDFPTAYGHIKEVLLGDD